MRASLFYNPFDLIERLARSVQRRRRWRRVRGTPAAGLTLGHLDSLELLELLKPAPPAVIHDIGANVGTWTCLAKSIFPAAAVEAFEPLEAHFAGFRRRTATWPDVQLHAVALGSREGTTSLEVVDFSDASSVLPLTADGQMTFQVKPVGRQEVRLATLDGLVAAGEVRPADLLKLDVQGYELEVLRGAEKTLAAAVYVIAEVSFREFYRGQPLFAEVVAFLAARGFHLRALGTETPLGKALVQTDALFVQSGRLSAP
jgi:FkbM family methyltransferase